MKTTLKFFTLILSSLLLFTACIEIVPPKTETGSTSANTTESVESTTGDTTPEKPLYLTKEQNMEFFGLQPAPKKTYDEAEIYRHVFENHSRKLLTPEEAESIEVDFRNAQALISVCLDIDKDSNKDLHDVYLVEGFTTKDYNQGCSKYRAYLPSRADDASFSHALVLHDYHEAYLDILFANLTFSECESIPDYDDLVYPMGAISLISENRSYSVRSDGYLYYTDRSDKDATKYFKSDRVVDVAYLASIEWLAYFFDNGLSYDPNFINEIFELSDPYTVKKEENGYIYYADTNGTYYAVQKSPLWLRWVYEYGSEFASMNFYYQITHAYRNYEAVYGNG